MKKILLLMMVLFTMQVFTGCKDPADDKPTKPEDEVENPADDKPIKPEDETEDPADDKPVAPKIVIESPDVFQHGQKTTVNITVTPIAEIASTELYIDGVSYEKKFTTVSSFDVDLKNSKTGVHKLVATVVFKDGSSKNSSEKEIKYIVKKGDTYAGGMVIRVNEDGTSGTIAAKSNLEGGLKGRYRYGFYGAGYQAHSMDDGVANTNAFKGTMNDDFAAIACLNLELNGYDDWYMPAYNEFKDVNEFEDALIQAGYDNVFWTSTLRSDDTHAEIYTFGRTATTIKDLDIQERHYVRPFRKF